MQGAAFALRAGATEWGLLLFGQQCVDVWGGGVEMEPAEGQCLPTAAVGEQSEVPNLDEA